MQHKHRFNWPDNIKKKKRILNTTFGSIAGYAVFNPLNPINLKTLKTKKLPQQ